MPAGAPTKYRPQYCQMLIDHMAAGLSFCAFGGVVGVTEKTLYNWTESFPEFKEAQEIGLQCGRLYWEKICVDHIINKSDSEYHGSSSSRSLNASAFIFVMKNRFGWRDKQPDEEKNTTVTNNNISLADLTDEQRAELLKIAMGKK